MKTGTIKRILTAAVMVAIISAVAYFDMTQILAIVIAAGMIGEIVAGWIKSKLKLGWKTKLIFAMYSILFMASAYFVGQKPWIMLLLFLIIAATDTGAWYFGCKFGGDKMWPSISPNKTWTGQITGIASGTLAAVMYGLLGTDMFLSSLMWIGIGVSLLSQYGDLMASAIKRKFGLKDYSNLLPGHGGLADRFDGWIFVLPVVWLATL